MSYYEKWSKERVELFGEKLEHIGATRLEGLRGGAQEAEAVDEVEDLDKVIRLMSINTTILTKARLEAVWVEAQRQQCDVIVFQETRHAREYPWAARFFRSKGWGWQLSVPAARMASGAPGMGGTAVAWKLSLGKSADVKWHSHRGCGRSFVAGRWFRRMDLLGLLTRSGLRMLRSAART
jgi:hypothetical protein